MWYLTESGLPLNKSSIISCACYLLPMECRLPTFMRTEAEGRLSSCYIPKGCLPVL